MRGAGWQFCSSRRKWSRFESTKSSSVSTPVFTLMLAEMTKCVGVVTPGLDETEKEGRPPRSSRAHRKVESNVDAGERVAATTPTDAPAVTAAATTAIATRRQRRAAARSAFSARRHNSSKNADDSGGSGIPLSTSRTERLPHADARRVEA